MRRHTADRRGFLAEAWADVGPAGWGARAKAGSAAPISATAWCRLPVGPVPFSRRSPPVVLVTEGHRVGDWPEQDNAAAPPPSKIQAKGPAERLVLMPYAAPKLRITVFPLAKKDATPTASTPSENNRG